MLNERNQGPARIVVQRQANQGGDLVTPEADTLIGISKILDPLCSNSQ